MIPKSGNRFSEKIMLKIEHHAGTAGRVRINSRALRQFAEVSVTLGGHQNRREFLLLTFGRQERGKTFTGPEG
jgi:hypothetical protein